MNTAQEIISQIKLLSKNELNIVKGFFMELLNGMTESFAEIITEEKTKQGIHCPCCNSASYAKNGLRTLKNLSTVQVFICKDCGKKFSIRTNTIAHCAKLSPKVLDKYLECYLNGLSIRKTAEICEINKTTAFYWRHKINDALQNMMKDVILDGVIEGDETFFNVSYKGNHSSEHSSFVMPRRPHKRGKSIHKRGLSREKVCVPCLVNRNGLSYAKISNKGRVSSQDLHNVLDGRIKEGSVLVTDVMNSYVNFASENNLDLIQIKGGKGKKGIYNIQHINSYHSILKSFIERFNGVSSKYLNNYLVWNNFANYSKGTFYEKKDILRRFVLSTEVVTSRRTQSLRPEIPLPTTSSSNYINQLATEALSLGSCS